MDHVSENLIAPPNPSEGSGLAEEGHDYYSISTLIIKGATVQHAGKYTCVADLPGDRQTKSYNVQVSSPTLDEDNSQYLKRSKLFQMYHT